jgi:hypothetical protein
MVTRTMAVLPARPVHMPKLAPQLTHVRLEGAHDDGDVLCLRRQPVNTPHSSSAVRVAACSFETGHACRNGSTVPQKPGKRLQHAHMEPMLVDYGQGSPRAQRRADDTRRLSPHAERVHEVFAHVPSCSSRGRPPCTQIPQAASGRAMLCSPRLRVFVPYDFGFQPIRIAEEDAQGRAEIGNSAIRGA